MKNRFGFNPTGGQIDRTFLQLVRDTLNAILQHSDFIDVELPRLLAYLAAERRCKRSVNPIGYATQFIVLAAGMLHDRDRMLELLMDSTVERSVWVTIFGRFAEKTKNYPHLYRQWMQAKSPFMRRSYDRRLAAIEAKVGISRDVAYPAITEFHSRFRFFNEFKNDIVYQYVSLAGSMAKRHAGSSSNISMKDLNQSMLANMSLGIDKYSSQDGAMANYLKFWAINTYSSSDHLVGTAYSVPNTVRKKIAMGEHSEVNFGVSLDAPLSQDGSGETTLSDILSGDREGDPAVLYERQRKLELLGYTIKRADPFGVFRLATGLAEVFTPEEVTRMKQHMQQQNVMVV